MKIFGVERIEGGVLLHTPSGKRMACTSHEQLGRVVTELAGDEDEPEAAVEEPRRASGKRGPMGAASRRREAQRPPDLNEIRNSIPSPKPGESADAYVRRLAGGAALSFWQVLQRASQ